MSNSIPGGPLEPLEPTGGREAQPEAKKRVYAPPVVTDYGSIAAFTAKKTKVLGDGGGNVRHTVRG